MARLAMYCAELMKYCKALDLITPSEVKIEYAFLNYADRIKFLEEKIRGYKNVRINN